MLVLHASNRAILHTFLAVPSVPTKLHYTRHSFNVIRLNWSMLQYGGHSNSSLKFNVKCKQYNIDAWGHCRNISLGVRGVNVTIPPVDIKNLLNNTNYTFIVYALNEVSSHVSEANWEKATIPVHLPGSTQYPRTTHTTQNGKFCYSLFVIQFFLLKVLISHVIII